MQTQFIIIVVIIGILVGAGVPLLVKALGETEEMVQNITVNAMSKENLEKIINSSNIDHNTMKQFINRN